MSILIKEKQQVEFKITVNLNDLLYHLEHHSEKKNKIVDFKNFFQENPKELEKFLKECKILGQNYLKNELDEVEEIIVFANKIDSKIKKDNSTKYKK